MFFKKRKQDQNQNQQGQAEPGGLLRQETERLIAKGRLKEAVKQAKLCYREAASPEHHQLLERAYFLRAQQLQHDKMPSSAVEVATHLLSFGVTDPELIGELIPLLLALGMSQQALTMGDRLESSAAKAGLTIQAADQAVLDPARAPASMPELREGALQVRAALEALEAGDEARALEALRDVARGSPFGDWKLFVRGLAAFYRQDAEQVAANWDRLDPNRRAVRIAQRLRELSEGANLATLERRVFGEPILDRLEQLRQHVNADRWPETIRLLSPLRDALRRYDRPLAERLTNALIPALVESVTAESYGTAKSLIRDFTKKAEPPALDPRWNRLWALIWEGPQGGPEATEHYWRAYLKDLETLPSLPAEHRRLAQGLVCKHLGEKYLEEAHALAGPLAMFGGPAPSIGRQVQQVRQQAVDCLEESLRLAPGHRPTYQCLLEAYRDWKEPAQEEATARRLLAAFPEDFETLFLLAARHFRRDEPAQALEYAQRARALKPLDEAVLKLEWGVQVALARHHALQKHWDAGRLAFEAAARLRPEAAKEFTMLAKRAIFERKAGAQDRAEELIQKAQAGLVEPTPLWLVLQIEAVRYRLSKPEKGRFARLWKDAIKRKCRSETAGAIASLLGAYLELEVEYTGRASHLKDVVAYLRRTSRIKYRQEDMVHVCEFLAKLPQEAALYEKMIHRGITNFPQAPLFRLRLGLLELQKGPMRGDLFVVRIQFETALKLAEGSADPRDQALVPQIRERLSVLSALTSGPLGMMGLPFFGGPDGPPPGGPPPGGGGPRSPLEDLLDMFGGLDLDEEDDWNDEDDDWDDELDDLPFPLPMPQSQPQPQPPKSQGKASKSQSKSKSKSKKKKRKR